jgi:hypothetical protein
MLLAGFEPTVSATEWLQIHVLHRVAAGIGLLLFTLIKSSNGVKC